ncbi:hypothetical protein ODJ79_24360 [Actinoplanes sp. KI2]|uniref:hypothetical protein n=1 Tax=Actinoplanes sp. KI2 TaxID=2983315 RepID=UPI0021D5F1AE|nr:hypothetical protein [Actinoplanes sp. KI2]MCU7726871.1 hypothetical protein [Actinoplanes sp. KI2]
MPDDHLNYPDMIAEATREAALHGLMTSTAERDQCLFVTLTYDRQPGVVSSRREVTFWTSGTGAFLINLDQRWSWNVMAYERAAQIEAIHDIVRVAHHYLSGAGEETCGPGRRGRPRLVLHVDGDQVVLQERKPPGR